MNIKTQDTRQDKILEEIDLSYLYSIFRRSFKPSIFIYIAILIFATIYCFNAKNLYASKAIIKAKSDDELSQLSSLTSSFSNLANIAGISLGSQSDLVSEAIVILNSDLFLSDFIKRHNLKHHIFYKNWDNESNSWKNKTTLRSIKEWALTNLLQTPENMIVRINGEPNDWEATQRFRTDFSNIYEDRLRGDLVIEILSYNPEYSKQLCESFIKELDSLYRNKEITSANENIQFLKKELTDTADVAVRQAAFNLIEIQAKRKMLASAKRDFMFDVIDPPTTPTSIHKPNRLKILAAATIGGLILSFAIVMLATIIKNLTTRKNQPARQEEV